MKTNPELVRKVYPEAWAEHSGGGVRIRSSPPNSPGIEHLSEKFLSAPDAWHDAVTKLHAAGRISDEEMVED